jgi:TetR/AcrR family transcriptional regulator, regulator of cefoperazone and chloramphenicol sensitivity
VLAEAQAGPDAAIEAFLGIQSAVTDKIMSEPEAREPSMRLFFVREQMGAEPPEATEILMRRVRLPLNQACAALLERITGVPADSELTRIRVFTVFGQSLMFHIAPRTTLSVLQWPDFGEGRVERVRAILLGQTRVLLERWQAERA